MKCINEELKCRKCGAVSAEFRPNGPHMGAYCTKCGAWIKWVGQKSLYAKSYSDNKPIDSSDNIHNDMLDKVLDDKPPF